MKLEEIGLASILRRYQLIVPPNQREYSWETEHVETLFHDIARAISDAEASYFIGTIVGVDRSSNVIEIVDGQQRLATTVIFLSAIKKYLQKAEPDIAESISPFLTEFDRGKRELITKMQLNLIDNEFFKSWITENTPLQPTKPSHKLIQNASSIADQQIKKIVSAFKEGRDQADALNKWINFLEYNAIVILLTVDSSGNSYKMFETLNDRGLKTSQADLVKNYLFGQSDSRIEEAIHKWAQMRGALEAGYEEDITVVFLRHVLIAMRGHTKQSEVFDVTENIAKGPGKSIALLDDLEKLATTYVAITNPENDKWVKHPDTLRRSIQTLNLLDIQPFYPILLSIAEKFDPREAANAMQKMISLGVRLFIASRTTTGPVEVTLANAANKIYSGTIKNTKELIVVLKDITPNDESFKQAFETATVSKAALARYYLRSLEMAAKKEPAPWFIPNDDKETITLEHVLPIKPTTDWTNFTPDEIDAFSKKLGNMALLIATDNCDLRSADFTTKKKVYKKSGYLLTSQISSVPKWTVETISKRQKGLSQYALKAWPI